jgi:hypothetical protein
MAGGRHGAEIRLHAIVSSDYSQFWSIYRQAKVAVVITWGLLSGNFAFRALAIIYLPH